MTSTNPWAHKKAVCTDAAQTAYWEHLQLEFLARARREHFTQGAHVTLGDGDSALLFRQGQQLSTMELSVTDQSRFNELAKRFVEAPPPEAWKSLKAIILTLPTPAKIVVQSLISSGYESPDHSQDMGKDVRAVQLDNGATIHVSAQHMVNGRIRQGYHIRVSDIPTLNDYVQTHAVMVPRATAEWAALHNVLSTYATIPTQDMMVQAYHQTPKPDTHPHLREVAFAGRSWRMGMFTSGVMPQLFVLKEDVAALRALPHAELQKQAGKAMPTISTYIAR